MLPGSIIRVSLIDRADLQSLLQKILTGSGATIDATSVNLGCIPLAGRAESSALEHDDNDNNSSTDQLEGEVREVQVDGKNASQSSPNIDPASATPEDLFSYGTVVRVVGLERGGFLGPSMMVEGLSRFKTENFTQRTPFLEAEVEHFAEDGIDDSDELALATFTRLKTLCRELLLLLRAASRTGTVNGIPFLIAKRLEMFIDRKTSHDAGSLADFFVSAIDTTFHEKLEILEATDVRERLERAVDIVQRKVSSLREAMKDVPDLVSLEQDRDRRLRQMVLRKRRPSGSFFAPPGDGDGNAEQPEEENELADVEKAIEKAHLSPEAEKILQREMKRLRRMSPVQAEYQVLRTYVETLLEIPWVTTSDDRLNGTTLARAKQQLDKDHYGLEKIKRRLVEYLAVLRLKRMVNDKKERKRHVAEEMASSGSSQQNEATEDSESQSVESKTLIPLLRSNKIIVDKSPILLLVGPPGTGKTSLARSVATALGRKFHRISLGGVRDEAEIRGHRRTYVAAMPGLIVNALRKVKVANPVILLDEIDKVGHASNHGDPSAALLEVLDPEQNWTFTDHYINIPIDLSKVLFICTANSLDTIPGPLLDRMETIQLSGYTTLEKKHIALQYLVPKQLTSNGLSPGQVKISDEVLNKIVTSYTLESGVRNLEREIGSVCRSKAVEYASALDSGHPEKYSPAVSINDLDSILGIEKFDRELALRASPRPGIVTGLVAYSISGNGSILFIEAADMPGSGRLQLTGKLGEVIKESVEVALTWVKAHAFALGLTPDPDTDLLAKRDVHVHCPAGAVPKDGPSAGAAFTIALISLFSGRVVPPTIAMTGETSLRGRVTAVGGIKEKLIGALSAGVKTVILPRHNRKDVRDLPDEVKNGLDIVFVSNIYEVMKTVWPQWVAAEKNIAMLESVL